MQHSSKRVGLCKSDKLVHMRFHSISPEKQKNGRSRTVHFPHLKIKNEISRSQFRTRLFPRLGAQTWGACAFDASSCVSPTRKDTGVIQKGYR